jgi:Zn-finger nucleic acid-binding protein
MKNKLHQVLKRQKLEKLEFQYCPKCEIGMFMTNSEMTKHLEDHKKKCEDGIDEVDEDDF